MWNLLAAFLLIGAHSLCTALPVNNAAVAAAHQHDTKGIAAGSECNDIDEVTSNDPCQPFCVCHDGKVFCAELYCSRDNLPTGQNCRKVPTNGKCCPSYLCMTETGLLGELHYPLPQLFLPPELGLTGAYATKSADRPSKLKTLTI